MTVQRLSTTGAKAASASQDRTARLPAHAALPLAHDLLGLQRAAGNAAVSRLVAGTPRLVQRATNIPASDWSRHKGEIDLDSGGDDEEESVEVTDSISAKITENRLNHYRTGHTIEQFSFEDENIDRSGRSGFWPATYGKKEVLGAAKTALTETSDEIEEAVGQESQVNLGNLKSGGWTYVAAINTKTNTDGEMDEDTGNYKEGTASLEQFYPIAGPGFLYADKDDLKTLKKKLGK